MKHIESLKKAIKYYFIQNYCAIQALDQNTYALSAITRWRNEIQSCTMACGTLDELARNFNHYGLAISISNEQIITKNWFFPKSFSVIEIYHQIIKNKRNLARESIAAFDIEIHSSEGEEQLVIGYFLPKKIYEELVAHYKNYHWRLAAIEPDNLLSQRPLNKAWQFDAKEDHQDLYQQLTSHHNTLDSTLKLVDRKHFIEIL